MGCDVVHEKVAGQLGFGRRVGWIGMGGGMDWDCCGK